MNLLSVEIHRQRANHEWRDALRRIHRFTLLQLAMVVRAEHPTATHLVVDGCDQGAWLTPWYVDLADGTELDIDECSQELQDQLNYLLRDIVDEDWAEEHWVPFVAAADSGLSFRPLDIALILEHGGRADLALAARSSVAS
jgi:hypothetical protein